MPKPRYYKGIYCPTITNRFEDDAEEQSYQRCYRRQRQKSLVMVNFIDLVIKVAIAISSRHTDVLLPNTYEIVWTVIFACLNLFICILSWKPAFANHHLHWAAAGTWVLLIVQGLSGQGIGFHELQNQVWYMLFIVFVPYAMYPLSVCWCVVLGVLSFLAHTMTTIVIIHAETSTTTVTCHTHRYGCAWRLLGGNVLLHAAVNFAGLYAKSFVDWEQRKVFMETRKSKTAFEKTRRESNKQWSLFQSVIPDYFARLISSHMCRKAGQIQRLLDEVTYQSNNVSILFADIKGFTELSSKCSAQELVELLNTLFARFDKLASENQCLRIKLLGDCYFCVCGMLDSCEDHAQRCVNMGLQMIRVIRNLRQEEKNLTVDLDMRIGIHSGKVLCGVLGQLKWQLDLWSRDVTIANLIESCGLPGRVHISSSTFEWLKGEFEVEPGDGGARNQFLQKYQPVTYFIKSTEEQQQMKNAAREENGFETCTKVTHYNESAVPASASSNNKKKSQNQRNNKPLEDSQWKPELPFEKYYQSVRAEHDEIPNAVEEEGKINYLMEVCARNMYIWSLRFKRSSLESSFAKLDAGAFKSNVMCCMIQWLFVVAVQTLAHYNCRNLMIVLMVMTIPLALCFVLVMIEEFPYLHRHLVTFSSKMNRTRIHRVMHICFLVSIMSLSSTMKLYICPPLNQEITNDTSALVSNSTNTFPNSYNDIDECHHPEYVVFTWVLCLVALTSVLKLYYLIKTLLATAIVVMYCILLDRYSIHYQNTNIFLSPAPMLVLMISFLLVVIIHARQVEVVSRLDFLWKRQAKKDLARMESSQGMNRQLLCHVLPNHVVDHFLSTNWQPDNLYSQQHDEVGVMFACIGNFDSIYWAEYAFESLQMLNKIILAFDKLLMTPEFGCIEKIKTINATYMAASGLDPKHKLDTDDHGHLHALVDYAFALKKTLAQITVTHNNSCYDFKLRAGISCGPLVGGVIGARRPVYDIWGNTVNEASRMESTGALDKIQVTKYTTQLLQNSYVLKRRGEVQVKGKGTMETWWVESRLPSLPPRQFHHNTIPRIIVPIKKPQKLSRPEADFLAKQRIGRNALNPFRDWPMLPTFRFLMRRGRGRDDISEDCSEYFEEPEYFGHPSSPELHPLATLLCSAARTREHIYHHPLNTYEYTF